MSLPYENASSGKSAIDDMAKLLRVFGASSFGTMEDFAAGKVIVQFEHRGRRVSIEASFWGYAAAWKRAHPYTSRSRRDRGRYEALALKRGEVAVWSILRDWLKGQLTAIEVGMQSFESAFLAQLTLPTGETVMQRLVESKQLMLQGYN